MLSLVPKKGQVILEMANLLCGPEVVGKSGEIASSPKGTPNGNKTRNSLLPEIIIQQSPLEKLVRMCYNISIDFKVC